MSGDTADAHTALAGMANLPSFIDTSKVCGREDSKYVKIQVCFRYHYVVSSYDPAVYRATILLCRGS
jgi:hypothetical protein